MDLAAQLLSLIVWSSFDPCGQGGDSRSPTQTSRETVSSQTCTVLDCIHRNLFNPNLSVKTLKTWCRIRDNNVSTRFKSETGVYLHAYIAALRLETAAAFLWDPHLTVAEVADRVGYRHLQTFYRLFQRYFRCNPGDFRALTVLAPIDQPVGSVA